MCARTEQIEHFLASNNNTTQTKSQTNNRRIKKLYAKLKEARRYPATKQHQPAAAERNSGSNNSTEAPQTTQAHYSVGLNSMFISTGAAAAAGRVWPIRVPLSGGPIPAAATDSS